jgi:hypothetical protein
MRTASLFIALIALIVASNASPSWASTACSWQSVPVWPGHLPGSQLSITSISAIGPNDIWAAGEGLSPGLAHWDGNRWSPVSLPDNLQLGYEESIAATADDDIWAVGWGYRDGPPGPYWLHFDGSEWTQDFLPLQPGEFLVAEATHVKAFSPSDVWAIGQGEMHGELLGSWVDHWNGSKWNSVAILPPAGAAGKNSYSLENIGGTSGSDLWLLGRIDSFPGAGLRTFIEHFDGGTWKIVPNPTVPNPHEFANPVLVDVYAKSTKDAWAVGVYYDSTHNPNGVSLTYTAHWNGSVWSYVPSPNVGPSHYQDNVLTSVSGSKVTDVWAVGGVTSGDDEIGLLGMHWDGISWRIVQRPEAMGVGTLRAIVDLSRNDVWAVGDQSLPRKGLGLLQAAFWCTPTTP